jgi:hypothetical protein
MIGSCLAEISVADPEDESSNGQRSHPIRIFRNARCYRVGSLRVATGEWRLMSVTVHEVRNAIRAATGRFEREFEASFTKEELQAICEALEAEIDVDESGRPSTTRMRRLIRTQVGVAESLEAADDSTFRKADLQAISDAVGASSES